MLSDEAERQLNDFLSRCDEQQGGDDGLRRLFSEFSLQLSRSEHGDPFSDDYRGRQLDLYRTIARRPYELANEASVFDVGMASTRPFPYSTGNSKTAGDHLVVLGRFLGALSLPPNARVVEFGPGWGNLTLALAALGHRVTAVDVEPRFCELIAARAARLGLSIEVVNADFSWAADVVDPFDAAVFFESFHHAADHLSLLDALHAAVRPEGHLYLGAEPITVDFPIPWGLRLDGQSLWAVRRFGWMELGFRDDYFAAALARTGWRGSRLPIPDPAIWVARREAVPLRFEAGDARLATLTGQQCGGGILLEAAPPGAAVYGPHVALRPGSYRGRIRFGDEIPVTGRGYVEISAENARRTIARGAIEPVLPRRPIEIAFDVHAPTWGVEVRFFNDEGFNGRVTAVEIDARPP